MIRAVTPKVLGAATAVGTAATISHGSSVQADFQPSLAGQVRFGVHFLLKVFPADSFFFLLPFLRRYSSHRGITSQSPCQLHVKTGTWFAA